MEPSRAARFRLTTAAHHFILTALPFRHPESRESLGAFVDTANAVRLSPLDRDAVLLRILMILEPHTGGRLPSLVDRYLALRADIPDDIPRFQRCVEDVIRYRGIGKPHVQQAIVIILDRHADSNLLQSDVAEMVGLTPSALSHAFVRQTGVTPTAYLHDVRLDAAARMLVSTTRSVKEVWSSVGYNDGASFDHDFKHRFEMTPTDYRARGIRTAAIAVGGASPTQPSNRPRDVGVNRERILIVDDDIGTRETLRGWLRVAGYATEVAHSAGDALGFVSTFRPDVVVLDYHLPDMDGLACLREIRRARPGKRPPVVLFTADWDLHEEEDEVRALGGTIVSKLCDVRDVERVVASLAAIERHAE